MNEASCVFSWPPLLSPQSIMVQLAGSTPHTTRLSGVQGGSGGAGLLGKLEIQKGVSSLLVVWYSTMQAMLLILLVRTMGKPALTSCS